MPHQPVLLKEVLDYLNPKPGQIYIDATFGGGGHSRELLKRIQPNGKILALDADVSLIQKENFQERLILVQGNFSEVGSIAREQGFEQVRGIIADLGLSSNQLDDETRGFTFQKDGPLDMRFDQRQEQSAATLVNDLSERDLAKIFWEYGEEKFSKKIARAIVERRKNERIDTTLLLFETIKTALPAALRFRAADSARRVFQALRIATNNELESLTFFLPQAAKLLVPKGRLVVISFHSLEDRIVKQFFLEESKECVCPKNFPVCVCRHKAQLRILTKRPIVAGEEEVNRNSRARSAKLRAAEKLES